MQARAPEVLRDGEGSVTCNSGPFPAILHLFTSTNGLALREKRLSSFSTFESREVLSSATTRAVGDRLGLLVWHGRVNPNPITRFRDVGKRGKRRGERWGVIGSAAPAGNQPFINAKSRISLRGWCGANPYLLSCRPIPSSTRKGGQTLLPRAETEAGGPSICGCRQAGWGLLNEGS